MFKDSVLQYLADFRAPHEEVYVAERGRRISCLIRLPIEVNLHDAHVVSLALLTLAHMAQAISDERVDFVVCTFGSPQEEEAFSVVTECSLWRFEKGRCRLHAGHKMNGGAVRLMMETMEKLK
jgi:hypothetical protein